MATKLAPLRREVAELATGFCSKGVVIGTGLHGRIKRLQPSIRLPTHIEPELLEAVASMYAG